jgi:hypothetical protein
MTTNHLDYLGKTVKDLTSGFSGVCIQTLENLAGNIQLAIQPKCAEGATDMPDAMFIDWHLVEIVDEGLSSRVTPVPNPSTIPLGAEVIDKVTKVKGIATAKATYINGCEAFSLESEASKNDKGGKPPVYWHSALRLEQTKKQPVEVARAAPTPAAPKAPGGPASKVPRQAVNRG